MFLVNGNPEGLRTAEISNWSGKAVAASRAELKEFLAREELDRPGIYLLLGTDSSTNKPAIYVGEAESLSSRIPQHSNKDFWGSVVVFFSKDENLTKAHSKYLEGKLIEKAIEAGSSTVINAAQSGARLPESDTAEMDVFLDNVFQLLPILGIGHFRTTVEKTSTESEVLFCIIKTLVASGKRTPNGFMVFKGSRAVLEHRPSARSVRAKREELIKSGVLKRHENHLIFTKDMEFGSPSMAAGVIRGRNSNGLDQWKNSEGQSLKQIERIPD